MRNTTMKSDPPPPFGHPLPFSRFLNCTILEKGRGKIRKKIRPPFFALKKRGARGVQSIRKPLILIAVILILCGGCRNKQPAISGTSMNVDSIPMQEFTDTVRMSMTEKDKKLWSLTTTHIIRYRSKGGTIVSPVDVIYYTNTGTSHLTADTGLISVAQDTLEALGNVVIKTYDNRSVTTSRIVWFKKTDRVESDRAVKMVTTEGDVYTGVGFKANTNLTEWRILKNVKAKIKNANRGFLE
jgi:LPS export ABC transporter protein LptC